jgi:hypothetical protein
MTTGLTYLKNIVRNKKQGAWAASQQYNPEELNGCKRSGDGERRHFIKNIA